MAQISLSEIAAVRTEYELLNCATVWKLVEVADDVTAAGGPAHRMSGVDPPHDRRVMHSRGVVRVHQHRPVQGQHGRAEELRDSR